MIINAIRVIKSLKNRTQKPESKADNVLVKINDINIV